MKESDAVGQPRATFQNLPDGSRLIQLLEKSDPSSFLHETGHLFLEMERTLAAKYGLTDDNKVLLEWLGVESFDDITTEHHEKCLHFLATTNLTITYLSQAS